MVLLEPLSERGGGVLGFVWIWGPFQPEEHTPRNRVSCFGVAWANERRGLVEWVNHEIGLTPNAQGSIDHEIGWVWHV
jgi:hypothetical protein